MTSPSSAIILLGGFGTRLRPFTLKHPKPLISVLNQPMFHYLLSQLKAAGVRDIALALGYKAAHFRRLLGDGRSRGVRFFYSVEKEPLGTGGAIRKASRHVKGTSFVLNGDALSDIDLTVLEVFHRRRKSEATLTLTPVDDTSSFGVVETARDGRITSFIEKPKPGQTSCNVVNAGCYLFEPSVFASIPSDRPVSLEREIFPSLLQQGRPFFGHVHRGFWSDVGTLPSYAAAHRDLLARFKGWRALYGLKAREIRPGVWAAPGVRVHPSAVLRGKILLGEGTRVEAGARLTGYVCAGPETSIGEGARVADSVLHGGVRIDPGVRVSGLLAGDHSRVKGGCPAPAPGLALGERETWSGSPLVDPEGHSA